MKGARTRAKCVFGGLLIFLVVLILRAGWIQIVRGDEYRERARRMHFRRIAVRAPRGRILDRQGRILAAPYHARSLAVDPQEIDDIDGFATRLAFLLGDPQAAPGLSRRIERRRRAGTRFAYLRRWVDREVAERIALARPRLPGLDLREEPRRDYPQGRAAAALIGAVGELDGRNAGLSGLELRYDGALRGVDGVRSVFRAGRGRHLHLYPERDRSPRPGADLHTTIDVVLQEVVEQALAALHERFRPRLSCAIVMDPRSGEILALAGQPAYDPGLARRPDVAQKLRIPAVQNAYPLGSVIKPLVMAWALTCGAVQPGQRIDCGPGHKFFGGRLLHDVHPRGVLELEQVLVKSSNIGMAQVGLALGIDQAHRLFGLIGFGRRTGIELPGEAPGEVKPRRQWSQRYTLISVSMGRELMATPLQLITAYSSLINGGFLPTPTLIRRAGRPSLRRLPFDPSALAFVRRALEKVVSEGTGRRARIQGLRVGGKTGTSKIELEGQAPKYVSSFVGFAPCDRPAMIVYVLADGPRVVDGLKPYGGTVAAPAVRAILRRGLPLVARMQNSTSPGSGVRHRRTEEGKVRVAAVHWSSVNVGERISPATGRNPDSVDVDPCRSEAPR